MAEAQPIPENVTPQALSRSQITRQAWLAAGLCTSCGKQPPDAGKRRCLDCLIVSRAKDKKRAASPKRKQDIARHSRKCKTAHRAKLREAGVCPRCEGVRDVPGRMLCSACHQMDRDNYQRIGKARYEKNAPQINAELIAKRKQWEADGLCNWCGGERDREDRKRCAICRRNGNRALKAQRERRNAAGLCPQCGSIPERGKLCNACRELAKVAYRQFIARRKESGLGPLPSVLLCVDCLLEKPITEFHKNLKNRSGRNGRCRDCKRAWHAKNEARINAGRRDKWAADPEKFRAQGRAANARKQAAYARGERKERQAREKAYHAEYNRLFPDKNREAVYRWRAKNPDWVRAIDQAARYRRQQKIAENGGNFTGTEWRALKVAQDYTCLACGRCEPDIKLSVDHVIPVTKGGPNSIDNIQGLCISCNCKKHTKDTDYRVPPTPN